MRPDRGPNTDEELGIATVAVGRGKIPYSAFSNPVVVGFGSLSCDEDVEEAPSHRF